MKYHKVVHFIFVFSLAFLFSSVTSNYFTNEFVDTNKVTKCFTCKNCTDLTNGIEEDCPIDDEYECLFGSLETTVNEIKNRYYIAGCLTKVFCRVVNFDPQYIKKFIEESNSPSSASSTNAKMEIIDFKCCNTDLCNNKLAMTKMSFLPTTTLETTSTTAKTTTTTTTTTSSTSSTTTSKRYQKNNNNSSVSSSYYQQHQTPLMIMTSRQKNQYRKSSSATANNNFNLIIYSLMVSILYFHSL